jgi:hypothetical protein
MRKLRMLTALAVIGVSACAERVVNPAVVPEPPALEASPKLRPHNVEARHQAERVAEDKRKRSASSSRPNTPSASFKTEPPPGTQTPLLQELQQPHATPTGRAAVAIPSPTNEPDESNFPFEVLMPPPPEPAEPTFPSAPSIVELPPLLEPAVPTLPEVSIEAAMPPPPEAAQPSFPVAALMPPPTEPAEPSLPSQEEIIAESPLSIPFPDLSAPLSMHPRVEWEDVTGSFDIPHSQLSEVFEARPARPERQVPSLIRSPWPLP